ncbi:MAG: hypothetical protein AB7R69_00390 [Candidatus Babeliales bacterium]
MKRIKLITLLCLNVFSLVAMQDCNKENPVSIIAMECKDKAIETLRELSKSKDETILEYFKRNKNIIGNTMENGVLLYALERGGVLVHEMGHAAILSLYGQFPQKLFFKKSLALEYSGPSMYISPIPLGNGSVRADASSLSIPKYPILTLSTMLAAGPLAGLMYAYTAFKGCSYYESLHDEQDEKRFNTSLIKFLMGLHIISNIISNILPLSRTCDGTKIVRLLTVGLGKLFYGNQRYGQEEVCKKITNIIKDI